MVRRSGELKLAQRSSIDVPPHDNRRENTPPYAAGRKETEPTVPPKIADMRNLKVSERERERGRGRGREREREEERGRERERERF